MSSFMRLFGIAAVLVVASGCGDNESPPAGSTGGARLRAAVGDLTRDDPEFGRKFLAAVATVGPPRPWVNEPAMCGGEPNVTAPIVYLTELFGVVLAGEHNGQISPAFANALFDEISWFLFAPESDGLLDKDAGTFQGQPLCGAATEARSCCCIQQALAFIAMSPPRWGWALTRLQQGH